MAFENDDSTTLERIFLRVVMSDTDEMFEEAIRKCLPLVLKKSGSPNESVRTQVIELLTHISKRVKATRNVQLPIEELIQLYQDPRASAFITNFSIIYIKMGFPRLPQEKKLALLPDIVAMAESKPVSQQESICLLFLSSLENFKYPRTFTNTFGLRPHTPFSNLLLEMALDGLLLPYSSQDDQDSNIGGKLTSEPTILDLSSPDKIEKLKLSVLNLLGALNWKNTYGPLIVGAADSRCVVVDAAESHLKRFNDIDYDDAATVRPLYTLYLDEKKVGRDLNQRIRLKLLQYMAKFRVIIWPQAIRVLFEGLYGVHATPKLKTVALDFGSTLIRNLPQNQLNSVWQILLNDALMKLLKEPDLDRKTKTSAFNLLSTLLLRAPHLAQLDLSPIEFTFEAIETETDSELRRTARDAAVAMSKAYRGLDPAQEAVLRGFLTTKLQAIANTTSRAPKALRGIQFEGLKSSRNAAVRFLSEALHQDAEKVYLLLQALVCGDEETSSEARKCLYPHIPTSSKSSEALNSVEPVSFPSLLQLLTSRPSVSPEFLTESILYLRLSLAFSAGLPITYEPVTHPSEASTKIRTFLLKMEEEEKGVVGAYGNIIMKTIQSQPSTISLSAFAEIIGCVPELITSALTSELPRFLALTCHTKDEVRLTAAQICSFLLSEPEARQLIESKTQFIAEVPQGTIKEYEKVHGSIALLGHIGSKYGLQKQNQVEAIMKYVHHPTLSLVSVSSLGLIPQVHPLPISPAETSKLVETLIAIIVESKSSVTVSTSVSSSKLKEKAAVALAHLSVSEGFQCSDLIFEKFFESIKMLKEVELCLSTGETLVAAVLHRSSPLTLNPWTRTSEDENRLKTTTDSTVSAKFTSVLTRILTLLKTDRSPSTRQTLCFWLLALTKHCSHIPEMARQLLSIQNGFIDLLSDSNSVVQEGAGRGLALVYDSSSDPNARSALLKAVVDQLTIGRKSVVKITDDTQLFQEGELGETPTGGKLSTYKELCQLASDLNQPDLIYRFMHLANHNSIWNSKKGAAYTISSLMAKAGPELDSHLPQLIVKLYRYQYDPIPHIQQSMAGVWASLAPPDALNKYKNEIFDDLLNNLTAVQWRVRISCCGAIQDLIRGPIGGKIIQATPIKIDELWRQLFRVMDDIHEGTREAATSAAKTLSKVCLRDTKPEKGKKGQELAGIVLKVLLDVGIKNPVAEVRNLSVSTLAEMVKEGLPKAEAPVIVLSLLQACSSIDLANLYVPGTSGAEALDKARIPLLKSSRLATSLIGTVPFITTDILTIAFPEFLDCLKPSAGFGTRVIAAHFIVLLSHHLTIEEFQPFTGKILGALLSGISDRSPGIRSQFGTSMGQLLRVAKDSSVVRLLEKLRDLYFDKEDEGIRHAIGLVLQSGVTHSQDCLRDKQDLTLPLVFFAKHPEPPAPGTVVESEIWSDLWSELAFGGSAMSANEENVIQVLVKGFESSSWKMKAQAARATKTMGLRTDLSASSRVALLNHLLELLPGRTWEGKTYVLEAVSSICKHSKEFLEISTKEKLVDLLIQEAAKGTNSQPNYKNQALLCLGSVVETLEIDSRFEQILNMLEKIIKGDADDGETKNENMVEAAYETLAKAWPLDCKIQGRFITEIVISAVGRLSTSTPRHQSSVLSTLFAITSKSGPLLRSHPDSSLTDHLLSSVDFALSLHKGVKQKREALNLLASLQSIFDQSTSQYLQIKSVFLKFEESLKKETAPEIKSRFIDLKELFRDEPMIVT